MSLLSCYKCIIFQYQKHIFQYIMYTNISFNLTNFNIGDVFFFLGNLIILFFDSGWLYLWRDKK